MLFKAELAQKIVDGVKTQTRRPVKAGEVLLEVDGKKTVKAGGRIKWQVGREYSVQYGRGLPTRWWNPTTKELLLIDAPRDYECQYPLKFQVTDIWLEDVRTISLDDAIAEGVATRTSFLEIWMGFYDSSILKDFMAMNVSNWQTWLIVNRPEELYQAWALEFEVVR